VFIGLLGSVTSLLRADASTTAPADATTVRNLKVEGSLDLENGVPIRWKKPDGSGYVNIFMLDSKGTLQLCHDPFYWDATLSDEQHGRVRIMEVRNPKSRYADFSLPVTRDAKNPQPKRETVSADSKLTLRSASFVETNDPAELNLIRTGTDDPNNPDDDGPTGEGTVPGLIRWMSKKEQITTDVEIIARSYGYKNKEHYGTVVFQPVDARFPDYKWSPMMVMKRGVRIGAVRGMQSGVVGSTLEVDCVDDRPVILRRPKASTTQPVMLAFAAGTEGAPADQTNTLATFKATRISEETKPLDARVELQVNKGDRMESALVLPAPAAQLAASADESVPSGELRALAFDQVTLDTDAIRDSQNRTRLVCRTVGRYQISASVEFSANGKGSRQVLIRRNGQQTVGAMRVAAVDGETTQITFTAPPVQLNPGDYVELMVRQTSGTALKVSSSGDLPLSFGMTRAL
jgi:hypothetical protein